MKLLITSLLLMAAVVTGFGAISIASENDPYNFGENFLYKSLGLGSTDAMLRFMTNQVAAMTIGVYEEDGTGGFEHGVSYPYYREESLNDFILHTCSFEFQRKTALNNYPMEQKFSIMFILKDRKTGPQFFDTITFIPVQIDGVWAIPTVPIDLKISSGAYIDTQTIAWDKIGKASLVAYDEKGSVAYVGDSRENKDIRDKNLYVAKGVSLEIGRKYASGKYSGFLTVAPSGLSSGIYSLKTGVMVQPKDVPILMGFRARSSPQTISLNGGAGQVVSLLCYENMDLPPKEVVLTLDEVGVAKWTNNITSSMMIFKPVYKSSMVSKP